MFDLVVQMFVQLIGLIPTVFGVYILFDLIGTLLFGTK